MDSRQKLPYIPNGESEVREGELPKGTPLVRTTGQNWDLNRSVCRAGILFTVPH